MLNAKNLKFDTRLDGIDQNGNPIRGRDKKKHRNRNALEELRRRNNHEEQEEEVEYRFSLSGLIPVTSEKRVRHEETEEEVSDKKSRNKDERNNQKQNSSVDDAVQVQVIEDFVDAYASNKMNTAVAKEIISQNFAEVANVMTNYSNPKYEKAVPTMNKIIVLMSTDNFSKMLFTVLKEGTLIQKNTTRDDMMRLFNLVLETFSEKFSTDVMSTYIDIITDIVCDLDIKMMKEEYGMSDDVALDFVVTIPVSVIGVRNDADIKEYARKFINVILTDYEETSRYMDNDMQKKIFYDFFNDKKDMGAIKAAGQCLTASKITLAPDENGQVNEVQKVLLEHYKDMLYRVLDEHDIPTIKIPLKFIVKELRYRKERNIDAPIMFDINEVVNGDYPNLKKAIVDLVENDASAAEVFDAE